MDICPQNIALKWHSEMSSSVYATPLITDLYSDGFKDIIVPSFNHYLEVVEGRDGAKSADFEAFHESTIHASPLLFDIDLDGVPDIVLATYDGEILFFRDNGETAAYKLTLPRLRVRRDWYVGLDPEPIDHSHPDVGDSGGGGSVDVAAGVHVDSATQQQQQQQQHGVEVDINSLQRRRLMQVDQDIGEGVEADGHIITDEGSESFHELFDEDELGELKPEFTLQDLENLPDDFPAGLGDGGGDGGHHIHHGLHTGVDDEDYHIPEDYVGLFDQDYALKMQDMATRQEKMWQEEFYKAPPHDPLEWQSPNVFIDPHILTTPSIADIDNDGKLELVIAVSYFFDKNYYEQEENKYKIPVGVDLTKYVATGIVVYDLQRRMMKWSQHLDLTSDHTAYKAYAYSTPTLVDVNGDGLLEIVVGTSVGFLYVLNANNGEALPNWPIQMGDIQGQVAVADINGDGVVEIVAADARGNVAAFNPNGKELWERHLGSKITAGATFADVDGDGNIEVLLGSNNGHVHVLSGVTGMDVGPFPFKTFGKIMAPVLPVKLDDPGMPGLQLVVMAFDGFLYAIDGKTACADSLDIGETSYAMVLAEDIDGDGRLELVVSSMNGNLYAIGTASKYQPLKAWPQQVPGGNGFTSRWSWQGVYATRETRRPRDVRSRTIPVSFTIVDNRPIPHNDSMTRGPYKVSVLLAGVGAKEMNAGDQPVIGMADVMNTTGTYTIEVPSPRSRTTATIRLEMKDESGVMFVDEFALSFHMHFYRLLKWLVVLPFMFAAVAVLGTEWDGDREDDDEEERLPLVSPAMPARPYHII